jgi:hypothetical protein
MAKNVTSRVNIDYFLLFFSLVVASQVGCDDIEHTLCHRAVLTKDKLERPWALLEEFV